MSLSDPSFAAAPSGAPMVIRALSVGGGILAMVPVPGASGRFDDDLEHIALWAPALVLTLVSPAELEAAGARALGAALQDRGTPWLNLTVDAGSGPDAAFRQAWPAFSRRALAALSGGGRIMIQGGGDASRTGMVMLRLMIETGEAPDAALARLRAVLPKAAAVQGQRDWAMAARNDSAMLFQRRDRRSEDRRDTSVPPRPTTYPPRAFLREG